MYSLVRSTVNQLGNMSAAGRRSPPQDDATLLYSVLRRPAAVCNVLRHCPTATVLTWHVALHKVKYIKIELEWPRDSYIMVNCCLDLGVAIQW